MAKHILLLVILATATCLDGKKLRIEDPFALIDKHLSHTFAYHYMWPWSQLIRAATALELEESFKEPQIISDVDKFQVNLDVKRYKPEDLKIRVKNRYIIIEAKHRDLNEEQNFMANHFVQRFVMPPGCRQEEVTAVLKPNGILSVTVPKHPVLPPIPERDVPIQVTVTEKSPDATEKIPDATEKLPETTEKPELNPVTEVKIESGISSTSSTTAKKQPALPTQSSPATALEQLETVEATTHVGKIRKKELKTTTKTTKDNEVTKGIDGNGIDYTLTEE